IDMSSVSLEESKMFANKLKEYEIHCIDAPVSGGEPMTVEGKLSIMAGGDKEHFNKIIPLFESIGENIVHFGTNGTGTAAKLANQIIVSNNLAALSEACVFASKSGIDLNKLFEAIRDRKSTRLNSSHVSISYAVFCLKKKTTQNEVVTNLCGA